MRSSAILLLLTTTACTIEQLAPSGPPGPRAVELGATAYDLDRGRLVFYGGTADGLPVSTTWEWDGTTWHQKEIEGPGALAEHAMAYDPIRKKILLYGGLGGARSCQRTWEYDGESWLELLIDGAGCRWRHTMTWDPGRRAVLLFGGVVDEGCTEGQCQETWSFNGLSWALAAFPP